MKIVKWLLGMLAVGLAVFASINYPKLSIISGYAANYMASATHIAKRSVESVQNEDLNVPFIKIAKADIKNNEAYASVFGLSQRKAVFREGLGTVLVDDGYDVNKKWLTPNRLAIKDTLPYPYGNEAPKDTVFENVDKEKLEMAVGYAFEDQELVRTRTLLVLYKGHIIAERYNEGFDENTPILGWSMTKSIIGTLFGIMQYKGKLSVESQAPVPEWQNDERKNITINDLLRMQSGLEWTEDYTKISDVTKMLILDGDMTQAAKNKPAIAKPGELWYYSSGTTNLLSGILRDQLGSLQAYLDFPYVELIDKIGMNTMVLETDLMSNFVGSSFGWASTRDWAKFGLLYLNRGNWNGKQIFAPEWVDYVCEPTAHSEGRYGAHFWLNAGGICPDVPRDMFSANGHEGQRVYIIPSKDLVVVRTGLAEPEGFENDILGKIVDAIN